LLWQISTDYDPTPIDEEVGKLIGYIYSAEAELARISIGYLGLTKEALGSLRCAYV